MASWLRAQPDERRHLVLAHARRHPELLHAPPRSADEAELRARCFAQLTRAHAGALRHAHGGGALPGARPARPASPPWVPPGVHVVRQSSRARAVSAPPREPMRGGTAPVPFARQPTDTAARSASAPRARRFSERATPRPLQPSYAPQDDGTTATVWSRLAIEQTASSSQRRRDACLEREATDALPIERERAAHDEASADELMRSLAQLFDGTPLPDLHALAVR
ncbi:hypothetical protein KFE25_012740 [Diacronema lutheri]|uniref:Uncharacterized protein n=1 Tax=Diacronema lutheri TaxID=2081491 RepID=A0A8J5XCB6_DIALT|nr:hypothetical protein KFE25_012740 [Diacronema lutheri]